VVVRQTEAKSSTTSSGTGSRKAADSIQSGPLRRTPGRIFDNQVEHASREITMKFGLIIILTM
jgi:hypothetical protein